MKVGALLAVAIMVAPIAVAAQRLPLRQLRVVPCCKVTAWNAGTGVATALVNASGQEFEFSVTNAAYRSRVKIGEAIYANFTNKQVSLDGHTACCAITVAPHNPSPAPSPARSPAPPSPPRTPARAATSAAPARPPASPPAPTASATPARPSTTRGTAAPRGVTPAPAAPCCAITAIDERRSIAEARVNATKEIFWFNVRDAATRAGLSIGQGVYANFPRKQVSLDGRTVCCNITVMPHATAGAGAAPTPHGTTSSSSRVAPAGRGSSGGAASLNTSATRVVASYQLPSVDWGPSTPAAAHAVQAAQVALRYATRRVTTVFQGRQVTATLLHLRGLDGIEQAPGLPDGVRRVLEMHVRTLPKGASDHYIVNTELAAQWAATHPVPADVKPNDVDQNTHSGCNTWSMHCAEEAYQHAAQQTEQQFEALRQQAVDAWNHASDELTHDWNETESCMADHRLTLPPLPVKFDITPSLTIPVQTSGSSKPAGASGTVKGTLGIGFPMEGNFTTNLDLFYIPCLPFVVRPRSFRGSGTLGVGERLTGTVTATGHFDKTFTIPPAGGPKIPIQVFPVLVAGVPVAEVDVSAYIEGDVELGGAGSATGQFEVDNPHQAAFDFDCSGRRCGATSRGIPVPTTAKESAELKGTVFIRPDIYTALQLDFDYDALSVRAGPQPYLLGSVAGCVYGAASQSTAAATTTQENHALTADLDWGVDLRAEALVASKVEARDTVTVIREEHIWFKDLAPGGSTALIAAVAGDATPAVGAPTTFKVRMPTCYPYSNKIHYRIHWTGNATPGMTAACQWQAGGGTCTFAPHQSLPITLRWPTSGNYQMTVTAVGDEHHRTFSPTPTPTTTEVQVGGG